MREKKRNYNQYFLSIVGMWFTSGITFGLGSNFPGWLGVDPIIVGCQYLVKAQFLSWVGPCNSVLYIFFEQCHVQ